MDLSEQQRRILGYAMEYSRLSRYFGIIPHKIVAFYGKEAFAPLVKKNCLDELKIRISGGTLLKGYKITPEGERILREQSDPVRDVEASNGLMDLLNDVYHIARMAENQGIAPKSALSGKEEDELRRLFQEGCLVKVRIKWSGKKKTKGYVVTRQGVLALQAAGRL